MPHNQYTIDTKVYNLERFPEYTMQEGCTVNQTVKYIARKWTMLILLELYKGEKHTRRFSELKTCLSGITQKVLSARLKELEREGLVENARVQGEYIKGRLDELRGKYACVGEASGIGLLWALRLKVDPKLGVGTWIRDWCHRNGMILRNNGDILVIAPSLVISRAEADFMLGLFDGAIADAMAHFGL